MIRWGLQMLRNRTAARYEVNKGPHGAPGPNTAATTCCARCAPSWAAAYASQRSQGTLQLFAPRRSSSMARVPTSRCSKRYGVRF